MTTRKQSKWPVLIGLLAVMVAAHSASASLIYQTEVSLTGTGTGNVLTVLKIQNTGTESGCVKWSGTGNVIGAPCPGGIAGGDEKTGTQTRTISELTGITQASDLAIIFNAAEPGPQNSVTVDRFVLTFYTPAGVVISSYTFTGPQVHNGNNSGIGGSGYIYRFDWGSAEHAQAVAFSGLNFGDNRIGISAVVSDSQGSSDTFFLGRASLLGLPDVPVPEPATFLTMGAGLVGVAFVLKRRRRRNGW